MDDSWKKKMNEEEYEDQVRYIKYNYPNKKVNIDGYGLTNQDVISNYTDILSILKNNKIKCAFCKKEIKGHDWIMVIHNPPDFNKPINLLFFCYDKECAVKWGEKRRR